MINFYKIYNKNGLDNEHYGPLIKQMHDFRYTIELKPIEHIIKKNPKYAYYYAFYVIKGRWYDAEPYIVTNANVAYNYAEYVLKERWYEVEHIIKKNAYWWPFYCVTFKITDDK